MREQVGARGDEEEGVQQHRAVGVEHALGLAGRARRVAERAGGILVELGPRECRRHLGQQPLVAQQAAHLAVSRHVLAVRHQHVGLDGLERGSDLLHQRQEGGVEEQRRVLGVVGDVGDLLGEQPRIDGVADRADAGDGEVELEVAVAVPGQRRHPVARLDAEPDQRVRQPADALAGGRVAVAVDAPLHGLRHHLYVGIDFGGEVDHARDQQRPVHHHPAQHQAYPPWNALFRKSNLARKPALGKVRAQIDRGKKEISRGRSRDAEARRRRHHPHGQSTRQRAGPCLARGSGEGLRRGQCRCGRESHRADRHGAVLLRRRRHHRVQGRDEGAATCRR